MENDALQSVQKNINYSFKNSHLLRIALTHRSFLNDKKNKIRNPEHNERLEFLGDAVLELVVTEYLYTNFKEAEGYMTALRASLVNYKTMADIGNELDLDNLIYISKGEKNELGKARTTIVANCMEAIIGAIYIDGGYNPAYKFIETYILKKLPEIIADRKYQDSKTLLQEIVQKNLKVTPKYKIIASTGKDHEKTFQSAVIVNSKLVSIGEGKSKQEAEVNAAELALQALSLKLESNLEDV